MSDDAPWDPDRPTQVECPACCNHGGGVTARCLFCEGVGIVNASQRKAWLEAHPPDVRPTTCPACAGAGTVVEAVSFTRYKSTTCPCCRGAGIVTCARAKEWRIAHPKRPGE